jgi:hypothetical protein
MIVQPETVLRWRRNGWSAIWGYRSRGHWRGGRPRVSREVRALITRMARENFLWGAPRILLGSLMRSVAQIARLSAGFWRWHAHQPVTSTARRIALRPGRRARGPMHRAQRLDPAPGRSWEARGNRLPSAVPCEVRRRSRSRFLKAGSSAQAVERRHRRSNDRSVQPRVVFGWRRGRDRLRGDDRRSDPARA